MKRILGLASLLFFSTALAGFSAQAAGAPKQIVIGSVVPLSGPLAAIGKPLAEGASACFDMINANGGINGALIRFELRDDQSDPSQTVPKTQELLSAVSPVALLNTVGPLQNKALIESGILRRNNIALIGPRDGSTSVREMKSPNHYFLIASVAAEAEKMVSVSAAIGRKRLAAIYSDDAAGREALKQIERAAKTHGSTIVASHALAPGRADIADIAKKVASDSSVQLALVYGVTPVVADFYRTVKAVNPAMPVTAFSETSHSAIIDRLGEEGSRGLMLSQVTYPINSALPLMKDFRMAMDLEQIPEIRMNNLHLEGYLAARILVEAIKKQQGVPTRESVIAALNQLHLINLGGLSFDFSNGKREGSAFVQIGIIGPQGKLMN